MSLVDLRNYIKTQKGYAFKSKWFKKKGIPIVKVKDFTDDSISRENVDYINDDIASDFKKYELYKDDVIIQTVGSWASNPNSVVGKAVKVPATLQGSLLNQNAVKIIPIEGLDNKFLYYTFRTEDFKGYIINTAQGAASQASITLESIKNYEFHLPPLHTQKRIADILSAYDDLIENNLKRIKLLEQAAQNIYKEWFVNLRFPGYEKTRINEETGLPVGWKNGVISDFGKVVTGKTPPTKRKDFYGIDVPFIKTPDMHRNIYMENVEQYISNKGADNQKNKYLPKNTVIVACIGARAGVVGITSRVSQTNQQINALISKDRNANFWFYFFFKGYKDELRALGSSGATMTNVSKGKFEGIKLIYPSGSLLKDFNKVTAICFDKILNLQKQNQKLKAARDILLPRLMNRTIEV